MNSEVNFSYEFSFNPSDDEVKEMISEWEKNHDSKWDDIGFVMKSEQFPRWLSNSLARDEFELDVRRIDAEVVDGQSLLDKITEKRDLMLALIN